MTANEKTYDVFVSYSYSDRSTVNDIVAQLEERGIRVFLDSEDIPLGSAVSVALERGLYKSNALLVFLSKQSIQSPWVEKEIETYLAQGGEHRKIVGVLLEDIPSNILPPSLSSSTLYRWQNREKDILDVIEKFGISKEVMDARRQHNRGSEPDVVLDDKQGNTVAVQVILDGDFSEFTGDRQEQFLSVIAKVLDIDPNQIVILSKRPGSIKYEFALTPEQAARLFHAISQNEITELNQFDFKSVRRLDTSNRVFIGHGRSPIWRELKDFIQDRLRLQWDEFNREPVAGYATSERLDQMLMQAGFAFLLMTAEDLHEDNAFHARENVIHEIGLFQGKLGRRKAIILLEEGCAEFSNIVGLSQIRFPHGNIAACFEEIRKVLEREELLS